MYVDQPVGDLRSTHTLSHQLREVDELQPLLGHQLDDVATYFERGPDGLVDEEV